MAQSRLPRQFKIYATFENYNTYLLIDTGATYSCLPKSIISRIGGTLDPSPVILSSCSEANIAVYGEIFTNIALPALRRSYSWNFVVADVSMPILGIDFLSHFNIIINCGNSTITDQDTNLSSNVHIVAEGSCQRLQFDIPIPHELKDLFQDYESIVRVRHSVTSNDGVKHFINTGSSPPPVSKVRKLFGDKLKCAKAEIDKLLKLNVIRPSSSPYASPIHMAKKGESYRLTGDYRALNSVTVPDRYPVPHLSSFSSKLEGCTVFSKIDLVRAYHHIPVNKVDIPKTAIITPFGLFEYLGMPYGLRNGPSTFQRHMDCILKPCDEFSFWFFDDILVASKNKEIHRNEHLRNIFKILHDNNLTINLTKSVFEVDELEFLGHHVSKDGIKPSKSKVEAVMQFERPDDYAGLRRYLGMLGFYRRMIPNFADRTFLLSEMLRLQPNAKKLFWSDKAIEQFNESKMMLSNAICLPHPSSSLSSTFHLVVDASSVAVGSALHQVVDSIPRPIAFFSKKLNETQRSYSTFDRELLAAYESVLHF